MRLTTKHAESDYWDLWQFLSYLHQDWPEMYGSPERALEMAVSEATPARLKAAHQQLREVLEVVEDDVDLRRVLNKCFGVNVHFRKAIEAKQFSNFVQTKLFDAVKDKT